MFRLLITKLTTTILASEETFIRAKLLGVHWHIHRMAAKIFPTIHGDTKEEARHRPPGNRLLLPSHFYTRLLLGVMDCPRPSKVQRCRFYNTLKGQLLHFTRFMIPIYLSGFFLVDIADWFIHQESLISGSYGDVREGRQNPIITKLAFLRSQITTVFSVLPTILLIHRAKQISICLKNFDQLRARLPVTDLQFSRRKILAELAVAYLLFPPIFRLVHHIYTAVADTETFWEPTRYFIFTVSTGQVNLFIQISVVIAECSVLPIYHFLICQCVVFCECSHHFNSNLIQVSTQLGHSAKTCPHEPVPFEDLLRKLLSEDEHLTDALEIFADCTSALLAVLLCGNCILMASITANGFVNAVNGNISGSLYTALFAASISSPIVALAVVIGFASLVHDTVSRVASPYSVA